MATIIEYRDPYDSVCSASDSAKGLEEIILGLMESPNPCDKALSVLYAAVLGIVDELDSVKSSMAVSARKAS